MNSPLTTDIPGLKRAKVEVTYKHMTRLWLLAVSRVCRYFSDMRYSLDEVGADSQGMGINESRQTSAT